MMASHHFRVVADSRTPPPSGAAGGDPADPGRAVGHDAADLLRSAEGALRALLGRVSSRPGLRDDPAGRALAADLRECLRLTGAISDAVFDLSRTPDALRRRLVALCGGLVAVLCDAGQAIRAEVVVEGRCPEALEGTVVRVAHELVGNAVEHGMHGRATGRVDVLVHTGGGRTTLSVVDDGWGCGDAPASGGGLMLAASLAARAGGGVRLRRVGGVTVAKLTLSHDPRAAARPGARPVP